MSVRRLVRVECIRQVSGRNKTGNVLQINNRFDHAGKDKTIVRFQAIFGRYGGDQIAVAVDFDQKKTRQVTESRFLDGFANQSTLRFDQHLNQILASLIAESADQVRSIGQDSRGQNHQYDATDDGTGDANQTEFKESHRTNRISLPF